MLEPPLHIQQLTKSYDGTPVVCGLNLEAKQGEIIGLLGPNGAGKSTTINMVAGVCAIDQGQIRVFGFDTRRQYLTTRRLIGVMHQEVVIEQYFTVGRALEIHCGYYGVRDDPSWRKLLIDRLELSSILDKKFIKLSGGMKRRFMIAKALIHKPKLLILDEPTAGVDLELRHGLWEFVREINANGMTILLTTHYLEEAEQMCDRVAILNHGTLVALESTTELIEQIGEQKLSVRLKSPLALEGSPLAKYQTLPSGDLRKIVFILQSSEQVPRILEELLAARAVVEDIAIAQPDLEDVFLRLTGKQAAATTKESNANS